jgi:hypothetical protein
MGVLTRAEFDALTQTLSRRWHLWDMHRAKEPLSEAPRSLNPGYTDNERLYGALTSGFSEVDETARSRNDCSSASRP